MNNVMKKNVFAHISRNPNAGFRVIRAQIKKYCRQPCQTSMGMTAYKRFAHESQNSACSEIRGQRYCEKMKVMGYGWVLPPGPYPICSVRLNLAKALIEELGRFAILSLVKL